MPIRRALFLDRDGVINVDHGYVCTRDRFEFVGGIFELCRRAKDLRYLIFVVTNQAGIGRGLYTEEDFEKLTEWMCASFRDRGAPIAKVYSCPFHPEFGIGTYRRESDWRKPGPGMIRQAAKEFDIDLRHSVLVGDRETDIQCGRAAGVACTILYQPDVQLSRASAVSNATTTVQRLVDALPLLGLPLDAQTTRPSCKS
jgi:D-glycero-D-manno-heptose 1,7-bisphosphate phosphatase